VINREGGSRTSLCMQKYCLPFILICRTTTTFISSSFFSSTASSSSSTAAATSCPSSSVTKRVPSNHFMNSAKQFYSFSELRNSTVGYCTDVEGNYEYWKRYVRLSKVLDRAENGSLQLKPHCHFVYGGDVCDRGNGDLRILKDLIELKNSNPERVHLILGNRDLNKIRLLTELQPESYSQPGETYWAGPIKQSDDFTAANRLKAVSRTLILTLLPSRCDCRSLFKLWGRQVLSSIAAKSSKKLRWSPLPRLRPSSVTRPWHSHSLVSSPILLSLLLLIALFVRLCGS
jgi:hypothetical protein